MKTVRLGLNLTEQFLKDPKVISRILRLSNILFCFNTKTLRFELELCHNLVWISNENHLPS